MKHLIGLLALFLSIQASSQDANYFHDGEHHYIVDGVDVSHKSPSILLNNEIMFEYDAKIYLVKNTDGLQNKSKKVNAELLDDRSKLKSWGIDFYVQTNDLLITYFNGGFQNPESLFLGADSNAYGFGNGSYFRLNNYNSTAPDTFEEIYVYQDGIWWIDGQNQVYALRNGTTFQGSIEPFRKGYICHDTNTNEYIWFSDYSGERKSNTIFSMEIIPEVCAINISTSNNSNRTIWKLFYQDKRLDYNIIDLELNEYKMMYYFDPKLKKAFIGNIPGPSQVMKLSEIIVPESETNSYWIKDSNGEIFLQVEGEYWDEQIVKKGNTYMNENNKVDGYFYEFKDFENAEPFVLYPAKRLSH